MVSQRELDEQIKAILASYEVEERDWKEEERKLFELDETYLRETVLHGNIFTGWGDPKTAPMRFRNAALRRKKRLRQDLSVHDVPLTEEEQLKLDIHRIASYSSVTSPAEPILEGVEARQEKLEAKALKKSKQ